MHDITGLENESLDIRENSFLSIETKKKLRFKRNYHINGFNSFGEKKGELALLLDHLHDINDQYNKSYTHCRLSSGGGESVALGKCCHKRLEDTIDTKLDAIYLAIEIRPYILDLICREPSNRRRTGKYRTLLKVRYRTLLKARYRTLLKARFIRLQTWSGDKGTFVALFERLVKEITVLPNSKLNTVVESFPIIDLRLALYSDTHKAVGCCDCLDFQTRDRDCLDCPSFKTSKQIERSFCLIFRKTLYRTFLDFVTALKID